MGKRIARILEKKGKERKRFRDGPKGRLKGKERTGGKIGVGWLLWAGSCSYLITKKRGASLSGGMRR